MNAVYVQCSERRRKFRFAAHGRKARKRFEQRDAGYVSDKFMDVEESMLAYHLRSIDRISLLYGVVREIEAQTSRGIFS